MPPNTATFARPPARPPAGRPRRAALIFVVRSCRHRRSVRDLRETRLVVTGGGGGAVMGRVEGGRACSLGRAGRRGAGV